MFIIVGNSVYKVIFTFMAWTLFCFVDCDILRVMLKLLFVHKHNVNIISISQQHKNLRLGTE